MKLPSCPIIKEDSLPENVAARAVESTLENSTLYSGHLRSSCLLIVEDVLESGLSDCLHAGGGWVGKISLGAMMYFSKMAK